MGSPRRAGDGDMVIGSAGNSVGVGDLRDS